MGVLAGLGHLLNGLAPGLFLALTLPLLSRLLSGRKRWSLWWQIGVQALLAIGVLVAGLVWTGSDGRMLSYAALVLVCGSAQAWMARA
jgi:hypothetical protein